MSLPSGYERQKMLDLFAKQYGNKNPSIEVEYDLLLAKAENVVCDMELMYHFMKGINV